MESPTKRVIHRLPATRPSQHSAYDDRVSQMLALSVGQSPRQVDSVSFPHVALALFLHIATRF